MFDLTMLILFLLNGLGILVILSALKSVILGSHNSGIPIVLFNKSLVILTLGAFLAVGSCGIITCVSIYQHKFYSLPHGK